ncbi:MAG: ketopantoate reductase family protein [Heliobacteriaceae bacterium]|jgi:2-dehydropantoate 2-reductase|nr:ketopantoate reductase family protein [Heliobacteriaceae bacterium]
MIKNVLICGIGAVGSVFAHKILENFDGSLKVLVDEKRLKNYTDNPPVLNGKTLNFDYILPEAKDYKADLIIIAVKFMNLDEAVKNIENFVYKNTLIIPLLNGVTSEETVAAKYGREHVLYSYFIGHSAMRTGNEVTSGSLNKIVFGSEVPYEERILRMKKFFDKVKIDYRIPEDIKRSLWLKFMMNVPSNQLSAVLRMTFGEMTGSEKIMDLMVKIMKEVEAVARAHGIKNTETMIDETLENLKLMTPEGKTSMLQDIEAGRKTEVEMFAGVMVEFGKKYNIPTPYNQALKDIIEAMV